MLAWVRADNGPCSSPAVKAPLQQQHNNLLYSTCRAEKNTRLGKELSGALVATLAGMALANIGVLPPGPKVSSLPLSTYSGLRICMVLRKLHAARCKDGPTV